MSKGHSIPDVEKTNIGAHAILFTSDNKVLLQQRDNNPNLINPGLISMFGGTIKASDTIIDGLKRELEEELDLDINKYGTNKLGVFQKTKEVDGVDYTIHVYIVKSVNLDKINVHEGSVFVGKNNKKLVNNPKLTRITKLALEKYFKSQL